MEGKIEISEINFGTVSFSDGEKAFCNELNDEIISLCQSIPLSMQTDALLFFMRYLRTPFENEFDFFSYFYAPAWSIIYWLIRSGSEHSPLQPIDIANAKKAHAMAMVLHALDDHLCDGEISVTHLALLARSQAWMTMKTALDSLAGGVSGGKQIVEGLIAKNYSSIEGSGKIESLDGYCSFFRKQMATWLVVPVLLSERLSAHEKFVRAVQSSFGSFGIAWRLLDDLKDVGADMMNGVHSSVYVCLSAEAKKLWDMNAAEKKGRDDGLKKVIWDCISENDIADIIRKRICNELDSAALLADRFKLRGLAEEYRCLARPLELQQKIL